MPLNTTIWTGLQILSKSSPDIRCFLFSCPTARSCTTVSALTLTHEGADGISLSTYLHSLQLLMMFAKCKAIENGQPPKKLPRLLEGWFEYKAIVDGIWTVKLYTMPL